MARNRKRKALYEVMSKTRHKQSYGKTLERLHPKQTAKEQPAIAKSDTAGPEGAAKWWRRPKAIQFNAGRIEISMPYQSAIAVLLGLVALLLIVFRFGQFYQRAASSRAVIQRIDQENPAGRSTTDMTQRSVSAEKLLPNAEKSEIVQPAGNNRIVIQTYQIRAHLEPVRQYFAQFGIATEIRIIGDTYYLVTSDKYENPARPGTDGYRAREKIIQLGANYKAPPGLETFGPRPFYDAYGMKFDD